MEVIMTQGCIYNSLTVNGKSEIRLTDKERRKVIRRLNKAWKPEDLNYLLQLYIELHPDSIDASDKPCECCGDTIVTYKAEI